MKAPNVAISRPGRARSRLEALIFAQEQTCPNCGAHPTVQVMRAAKETDGGFWEVILDCPQCGTVLRIFFDRHRDWPGGSAGNAGPGPHDDPSARTAVMAPSDAPTELFSADDLLKLRAQALAAFESYAGDFEADPDDAIASTLSAQEALATLRAMLELERLAAAGRATLPEDHEALRARLTPHAERYGVTVPPRLDRPPGAAG